MDIQQVNPLTHQPNNCVTSKTEKSRNGQLGTSGQDIRGSPNVTCGMTATVIKKQLTCHLVLIK